MELFLFGIIAAPGIQLLVETGVNFRKLTNQILTGSVLIAGVSGFSIQIGFISLRGMGLGLTIGVALNLVFRVLSAMGRLGERMTFAEALALCLEDQADRKRLVQLFAKNTGDQKVREQPIGGFDYSRIEANLLLSLLRGRRIHENISSIDADLVVSNIGHARCADVSVDGVPYISLFLEADGRTMMCMGAAEAEIESWIVDFPENVSHFGQGHALVRSDGIPKVDLREMLSTALDFAVAAQANTSGGARQQGQGAL
jgi:hypothetical protein